MSELIPINNNIEPKRLGDVVFVHGLDGDAKTTWHPVGKEQAFWPKWLAESQPHLGIWSLDYEASSLGWNGQSMPLLSRAVNCLELMNVHNIGTRSTVFIAHSLGGLLVKQMLRRAVDNRNNALASATKGIVFLATPHTGSNKATWLDRLGNYLPLRRNEIVKNLVDNDPALMDLNQWYRNYAMDKGIQTKSYFEESRTRGVITVVDRAAADPGIPHSDPIPLDADHITICKPESKEHILFLGVRQFLAACIPEGDGGPPLITQAQKPPIPSASTEVKVKYLNGDLMLGNKYVSKIRGCGRGEGT